MNIEEVRTYCLSLPEVTEDMPFGDDVLTFRIYGKIFLMLWVGTPQQNLLDASPRFALKLTPERNEELRERHTFITPAWHCNKKHWSDVYYDHYDTTFVNALIREAYELVRGKKVRG